MTKAFINLVKKKKELYIRLKKIKSDQAFVDYKARNNSWAI